LRPPGQGGKQILQEAGRRGIHQSSFGVESLLGARHQHLRLAQRQGANVRQHLAQMQLGSHVPKFPVLAPMMATGLPANLASAGETPNRWRS
jgi:hypothetical protein